MFNHTRCPTNSSCSPRATAKTKARSARKRTGGGGSERNEQLSTLAPVAAAAFVPISVTYSILRCVRCLTTTDRREPAARR